MIHVARNVNADGSPGVEWRRVEAVLSQTRAQSGGVDVFAELAVIDID